MATRIARLLLAASVAAWPGAGQAQDGGGDDASALAKKVQNPIASMISVPFQHVANFGFGPNGGTQNVVNIQPVVPFKVSEDLNVITRTVIPLIWQPSLQPASTVPFGLGSIQFSAFVSPAKPVAGWIVGAGPVIQLPTATSSTLGSNVWGAGPTAVVVGNSGPWVYGALVNTIWSLGGSPARGTGYTTFFMQPFVNYNFAGGWYVGTVPQITANWPASSNKAWTVPVGAQLGRVVKIGSQPINLSLGVYYNAIRPRFGSTWQTRAQISLLF